MVSLEGNSGMQNRSDKGFQLPID